MLRKSGYKIGALNFHVTYYRYRVGTWMIVEEYSVGTNNIKLNSKGVLRRGKKVCT